MNIIKSKNQSRLTDSHLDNCLRVGTAAYASNVHMASHTLRTWTKFSVKNRITCNTINRRDTTILVFTDMAAVTISASTNPSSPKPASSIHFDPSYVKTIPGIVKIAEAVCSLVGFICIQSIYLASYMSAGGWYSFVSMTGFWVSLILVLLYMFHIVERLHWMPWLMVETGFAGLWAAFFFIAACVAAANGRVDPGWGAAAFFGFLAMCIFGYEAFIKYKAWKGGEVAQGERDATNVESSTPTGPSYPTY